MWFPQVSIFPEVILCFYMPQNSDVYSRVKIISMNDYSLCSKDYRQSLETKNTWMSY